MDCTRAHLADMLQTLIVPIEGHGLLWIASGKVLGCAIDYGAYKLQEVWSQRVEETLLIRDRS